MLRLFHSTEYVGSGHDFDTTRKAKWVAESLERSPIHGIEVTAPISLMAEQVALDLDAHCGGGTASLIADDPHIWQIDVSVDSHDRYEGSNRIRLDLVTDAGRYLSTIRGRLDQLDAEGVRIVR